MLTIKKELVTPAKARLLLERNINNRKVKEPIVLRYSQDMYHGRWKEDTGELIKIAENGIILDGQHRLLAVIKSDAVVFFHIAYNVPENVSDVLDTGSIRNASDVFKLNNIQYNSLIPAIMQAYNILKNEYNGQQQKNRTLTNAQVLEKYYNDPEFWLNIAKESDYLYKSFAKIITPSFIGGFYARLKEIDSDTATNFMTELCTGIDITNQTISLLRQKLMQDKMSIRKMPPFLKTILVIKTWNCYIKGKVLKKISFDSEREIIPTLLSK